MKKTKTMGIKLAAFNKYFSRIREVGSFGFQGISKKVISTFKPEKQLYNTADLLKIKKTCSQTDLFLKILFNFFKPRLQRSCSVSFLRSRWPVQDYQSSIASPILFPVLIY